MQELIEGEEVQVSSDGKGWAEGTRTFLHKDNEEYYWVRDVHCIGEAWRWKYARRPLPKLRAGDWIIVFNSQGRQYGRIFKSFDNSGNPICYLDGRDVDYIWCDGWKPMPHYNYNHE
jgi:hypothetical protein